MAKRIGFAFLLLVASVAVSIAQGKAFTLVIDAGHGGKDAGALGAISKEKNINLNVALAFGRYVEQKCPDVKVVYTRKTDVFIPLMKRAEIANSCKADLFVSIHTNALPNGKISRGFETYTLGMHRAADNLDVAKRENSVILIESDYKKTYKGFDPNSSESYIMFELIQGQNMERSVEFARMVQKRVCPMAARNDKGVHQAGFLVLRETSMPSCLVELGFITTPDEERDLNNSNVIDNIARGLYNALLSYRSKYDRNVVVPYKPLSVEESELPKAKNPEKSVEPARNDAEQSKEDTVSKAVKDVKPSADTSESAPLFKIQILLSDRILKQGDTAFKGLEGCEMYDEGGYHKYTYGSSTDYNEIYRLRKTVVDKFPQSFIIAFKNGKKVNVVEAIKEFKARRAAKK